jgi:hypothetical protein
MLFALSINVMLTFRLSVGLFLFTLAMIISNRIIWASKKNKRK